MQPGEGTRMTRGVSGSSKIHVKRVICHNQALYVRNVNSVSNSCKIGLKGYDLFGDLTYL